MLDRKHGGSATMAMRGWLAGAGLLLAGCAAQPGGVEVPAEALVVATVRHTAGPQPAPQWIARESLPADAQRSDGSRALLLEVGLREGEVATLETAPLELANLIVRIESRDRRQTVIAIENRTDAALEFDLFVSPDGERFRLIPGCAIAAGGTSYERWPESAAWIAFGAVRRADARALGCD